MTAATRVSEPRFAELTRRYRSLGTPLYWLLTAIGAVWCTLIVYGVVGYGLCGNTGTVPCDAFSYWAVDATPYTWETNLEYRYSPAFLWVIGPFQPFPFELFLAVWTAAHIAALAWLRAGWFLIVPGLNDDVLRGNISTFIALFAVLAIQRSAAWWAPVLLTKVTPAVGIVWHLVRREWRGLGWSVGVTAGVILVGVLAAPDLWRAWVSTLLQADATYELGHPLGPLPVRLALAAAITAAGAWTGRAWLVPVALLVAVPGLWAFNLGLLAAVPRLLRPMPPAWKTGTTG
jgi:Glycosyltransferase family 87